MQSISLDMDDVNGAEDGYISDEEFPPLAGDLPPLSPTRSTAGHMGEDDNVLANWDGSDGEKENQGDKKRPRRVVIRKPQPKLDAVRLCSDRGLPTLSQHFEQVKFKGKGHEVGDLNRLMSTMEHWAHRLFPKMPFDEVIERIEKLGKKRQVQTCIKKIRLDMPLMDDDFAEQEADPEAGDPVIGNVDDEEVEMDTFSQLAVPSSQTMATNAPDTSVSLSDEQQKRMERNKRLAMERRKSKGSAVTATPASSQAGLTADDIQDLEREHADEEDLENELWNDIAMFEADQRNIWKTSPAKTDAGETNSSQVFSGKEIPGKSNTPAQKNDGQRSSQEVIDVNAKAVEEDTGIFEEGKQAGLAEVIDVDRGVEEEKTEEPVKDVVDVDAEVVDQDRGPVAEETSESMETFDVDTENEKGNMDDAAKEDGEENTSSDLVLKWDSESADESMIVQEQE